MARISVNTRKLILQKYVKEKQSYSLIAKNVGVSKAAVFKIIRKFGQHGCITDLPKTGPKKGSRNPRLEKKATSLLLGKETFSVREIAKKVGVSVGTVQAIKARNNIRTFKKQKKPKRNPAQEQRARIRAKNLKLKLSKKKGKCIIMDDETYSKMDSRTLPGPQFYNALTREGVPENRRTISLEKFGPKALVWQAICSCGLKSEPFFTTGTINGEVYRNECLKKRLFKLYKQHYHPPIFWPDLATCHYARETLELLRANSIDFVSKEENPPNCPQLRPIETYWAIVKRFLLKKGDVAENISDFKKIWSQATRKVTSITIKNLMKHVVQKVTDFSRG